MTEGLTHLVFTDYETSFNVFTNDSREVFCMNIVGDISETLEKKIKENLEKEIGKFTNKDNVILDFWSSKLQDDALYIYDTRKDDMPDILQEIINQLYDGPNKYQNNEFDNIKCIVTAIKSTKNRDENIIGFKLVYPMNRVAHPNRLSLFSNGKLKEVKKAEFTYQDNVDFFIYKNKIYIKSIKKFISFCSLYDYHTKKALETFEKIKQNFPYIVFEETKFDDISMKKKFSKLSLAKKVIEIDDVISKKDGAFSIERLKSNVAKNNFYKNSLIFEDNKLNIDKYTQFGKLLKLFNDEILVSNITDLTYDAKNKVQLNSNGS